MTEILEQLQTYVPSINCEVTIPEMGVVQDKQFLTTLVGGDYLSVARCRGAQLIRSTSELMKHTLAGILPVAEDWHAKVCFIEVSGSCGLRGRCQLVSHACNTLISAISSNIAFLYR